MCLSIVFRGRYTKRYLAEVESRIVFSLDFNIDQSTLPHFVSFFMRLVRIKLQKRTDIISYRQINRYLLSVEELAISFGRLLLLDHGIYKH